MRTNELPLLLVVAGPPASGKTTLSRMVGDAVGLPVLCRDGIKEGVVYTTGEVVDHATPRASALFDLFYELLDEHLSRGISVVAEAAFRADIAPRELLARQDRALIKLLRCTAPDDVWFDRFRQRAPRPGHADDQFIARTRNAGGPDGSQYRLTLDGVPTLEVDTTSGYAPGLPEILDFVEGPW